MEAEKMRGDTVEFCGELIHETDLSYRVFDGENYVWLAKSQIKEMRRVGQSADYVLTIPAWVAKKEGII